MYLYIHVDGCIDEWTYRRMDAWKHGRMDEWTNGRLDDYIDECIYTYINTSINMKDVYITIVYQYKPVLVVGRVGL